MEWSPHVRTTTTKTVVLLVDNASSHNELRDLRRQGGDDVHREIHEESTADDVTKWFKGKWMTTWWTHGSLVAHNFSAKPPFLSSSALYKHKR